MMDAYVRRARERVVSENEMVEKIARTLIVVLSSCLLSLPLLLLPAI